MVVSTIKKERKGKRGVGSMEEEFPILERVTWKVQRYCASDQCNNLGGRAFQEEEMQGRGPEVSVKWPGGQRVHQVGLHRSLE